MKHHSFSRLRAAMAALLLVTTITAPLALGAQEPFGDIGETVHRSDVEYIADRGITSGCNPPANDRYCPDRTITRGEMAAYLERAAKTPKRSKVVFGDTANSIFAKEIALIAAAGITKGCNPPKNDRYCPNDKVTRGQMAAFLVRAFNLDTTDVDYFEDDGGNIFEKDINSLADAGITVGCKAGSFCPNNPVTRAEMATFVRRALTGGTTPPTPPGQNPGTPPPGTPPTSPPGTLPPPGDTQPAGSVRINPGDSLAQAVAKHPAGTTFYLTPGVHRLATVRPKDNNSFVGAPGAIMSGSRVLSSFTKSGANWIATGQAQQNETKGTCVAGYTGCVYPEQLFIDGVELWQVTSTAQLKPGTWYFNYGTDTIYLADNPAGRLVETSVVPLAFDGPAKNVTVRDLVIEKYATPAQMGAIHGQTDRNGTYGNNWTVTGNEIRYNASEGLVLGHSMKVSKNFIHHNGRTGIGSGLAKGATIEGNEISFNCRGTGYLCFGWGGGGVKLAGAENTIIKSNYVHNNIGAGLHTDVQSTGTVFDGNTVSENDGHGIFVEVSQNERVINNRVVDNGYGRPEGRGAGIAVSASTNVVVTGNDVLGNGLGIVAYTHARAPGLSELVVTGNLITMNTNGHSGLRAGSGGTSSFGGLSIDWDNNVYQLVDDNRAFVHGTNLLTTADWLKTGYDKNSTFK